VKEFKGSESDKKRKKKLPACYWIRTKNQQNRIESSKFLKVLARISNWNSGKHKNLIFTRSNTTMNLKTM